MRIFISYSRKDVDAANALSTWLEARGADVFIDYQEILGTDHFPERLAHEIEQCDVLLLLLSSSSVQSRWVRREVEYADELQKATVIVQLEKAELPKALFYLGRHERIDGRDLLATKAVPPALGDKLARTLGIEADAAEAGGDTGGAQDGNARGSSTGMAAEGRTRPAPTGSPMSKTQGRSRFMAGIAIGLLLVGALAVVLLLTRQNDPQDDLSLTVTHLAGVNQSLANVTGTQGQVLTNATGTLAVLTNPTTQPTPTPTPTATPTPTDVPPSATPTNTSTPQLVLTESPTVETAGGFIVYRVQQGDTLQSIAEQYGLDNYELLNANPGFDLDRMVVGQEVIIPIRPEELPTAVAEATRLASLNAVSETQARLMNWEPQWEPYNGVDMVRVPGGCFMMGGSLLPNSPDEAETFPVCLDEFWLDIQEVWNEQFDTQGGSARVGSWDTVPDHPRTHVTWQEALEFCARRGARLPTEAEWEYAARGPFSNTYPWGGEFIGDFVNDDGASPIPIYEYGEAISWVGAFHMAGNAAEWTSSRLLPYPYAADDGREDLPADDSDQRVIRGGDFLTFNTPDYLASATRLWGISSADGGSGTVGFRCARDG